MAHARPLSFHATDVRAEAGPHEVVAVEFIVEGDDDQLVFFLMMAEEADDNEGTVVRVSWGNGQDGRDESVVELASLSLTATRFDVAFAEPRPASLGPCASVAVTFEALEPGAASLLSRALFELAASLGDKLSVPAAAIAAKVVPTVPRRVGPPSLGLAAALTTWRTNVSSELTLALTLTNLGGALEGVQIEIGGAALDGGLVIGRAVTGDDSEAKLEAKSTVAVASLPSVRLPADFDVDRSVDRKAAPAPRVALGVKLVGMRAGSGLLTVRVRPLGKTAGSAMVGHMLVID